MQQKPQQFNKLSFIKALASILLILASLPLLALATEPSTTAWKKVPKAVFGEVYNGQGSDNIFTKPHTGFFPAVQYMQMPLKGDFKSSARELVKKILVGFGEDVKKIDPKALQMGAVTSGTTGQLEAYKAGLASVTFNEPTATCVLVVKDKNLLRAVYARAFAGSLSLKNCQEALQDLGSSPVLYN